MKFAGSVSAQAPVLVPSAGASTGGAKTARTSTTRDAGTQTRIKTHTETQIETQIETRIETGSAEGRTRDAVAQLVHESGPQTAAALAARLRLSSAAVRRHLDALVADGIFVEVQPRTSSLRPRGRGRPARTYALTDAGRASFGHAYDDLASTALRYLRDTGGEAAVVAFAEHRANSLLARIDAQCSGPDFAGADPRDKAGLVAAALTAEGYAAKATPAGNAGQGSQICQHHCPVAHVAAEFPQLCEAETRALAEVLGTNVQRLATIAHGDGVCTTHVPSTAGGPSAPSQRTTTHAVVQAGGR